MDDAAFERRLIESEDQHQPGVDVEQAFSHFSARMTFLSSGLDGGSGVHPVRSAATSKPAGAQGAGATALHNAPNSAAAVTPTASTLKWLSLGALGGSALTAGALLLLSGRSGPQATNPREAEEVPTAVVAASAPGAPAQVEAPPVSSLHPTAALRGESRRAEALESRPAASPPRPQPERATSRRSAETSSSAAASSSTLSAASASTLAAEVAALDAVRRSNAAGRFEHALNRVSEFHRDYPDSVLSPDAEVLALEALQGLHRDTRKRRDRFLSLYPNDPHAERVRQLEP